MSRFHWQVYPSDTSRSASILRANNPAAVLVVVASGGGWVVQDASSGNRQVGVVVRSRRVSGGWQIVSGPLLSQFAAGIRAEDVSRGLRGTFNDLVCPELHFA
jgi:hypothetical protein